MHEVLTFTAIISARRAHRRCAGAARPPQGSVHFSQTRKTNQKEFREGFRFPLGLSPNDQRAAGPHLLERVHIKLNIKNKASFTTFNPLKGERNVCLYLLLRIRENQNRWGN